jgi:hypothetical protein
MRWWVISIISLLFCWLGTKRSGGYKRKIILRDNKSGKGVEDGEFGFGISRDICAVGGSDTYVSSRIRDNQVVEKPTKEVRPTMESITGIAVKTKRTNAVVRRIQRGD